MLVVDGTFEDQADELATFLDSLSTEESKVQEQVDQALQQEDKATAISTIVDASSTLRLASEKDYEPSHNLLIHLVPAQQYLDTVLKNVSSPPSFANGHISAFTVLTTLFNVSEPQYRLKIFRVLLDHSAKYELYDAILPKIKQVPTWVTEWKATKEEERSLYVQIADLVEKIPLRSTEYLIRATQTLTTNDDCKDLAVRTAVATMNESERLTFDDLLLLPAIRKLEQDSPEHYKLLNILSTGTYADYKPTTLVDDAIYKRKLRLLTLVTLAAKQDSRKLRYESIASALDVPESDVESWVIDTIKTGLVEGKLSQTSQTFLIHRATFRTFERDQWEEVSAKLASWKDSLLAILETVDNVRNETTGHHHPLTNGYGASDVGDDEDEHGSSRLDEESQSGAAASEEDED